MDERLSAGAPLVRVVETHFRTVTVDRPNPAPQLFTADPTLPAEPPLPGLQVREIFE